MDHALDFARKGVGLASPNPTVGCVIVRDGEIVGQGFHQYEYRDHAEIVALKAAGNKAQGATLYVTLEPCNHTGRTGPCTEAIIAAGIHARRRRDAGSQSRHRRPRLRAFAFRRNRSRQRRAGRASAAAQRSVRALHPHKKAIRHTEVRPNARRSTRARKSQAQDPRSPIATGSRRKNPAPKSIACVTPPTRCSPASAPSSPTIRFSPIAADSNAAAVSCV